MSHPDDAVDEVYCLYRVSPDGEKLLVLSSTSLPYLRLIIRAQCDAYSNNNLEVPTYSIEAE